MAGTVSAVWNWFSPPEEPGVAALGPWTTAELTEAVGTGKLDDLIAKEAHFVAMVRKAPQASTHGGACPLQFSGLVGYIGTLLMLYGRGTPKVREFAGRVLQTVALKVDPAVLGSIAFPVLAAVAAAVEAGPSKEHPEQHDEQLRNYLRPVLRCVAGLVGGPAPPADRLGDLIHAVADALTGPPTLTADPAVLAPDVSVACAVLERMMRRGAERELCATETVVARWCMVLIRRAGHGIFPVDFTSVDDALRAVVQWRPRIEDSREGRAAAAACSSLAARTIGEGWSTQWLHVTEEQLRDLGAAACSAVDSPLHSSVVASVLAALAGVFTAPTFPAAPAFTEHTLDPVASLLRRATPAFASEGLALSRGWWAAATKDRLIADPALADAVAAVAVVGLWEALDHLFSHFPAHADTAATETALAQYSEAVALVAATAESPEVSALVERFGEAWAHRAAAEAVHTLPQAAALTLTAPLSGGAEHYDKLCRRVATVGLVAVPTPLRQATVRGALAVMAEHLPPDDDGRRRALVDAALDVMAAPLTTRRGWEAVDAEAAAVLARAVEASPATIAALELRPLRVVARVREAHRGWITDGSVVKTVDGSVFTADVIARIARRYDVSVRVALDTKQRAAAKTVLMALRRLRPDVSRHVLRAVLLFGWATELPEDMASPRLCAALVAP